MGTIPSLGVNLQHGEMMHRPVWIMEMYRKASWICGPECQCDLAARFEINLPILIHVNVNLPGHFGVDS